MYTYELDAEGNVIPESITQLGKNSQSMTEGESMGSVNYDSDGKPLLLVIPDGGDANGPNTVSGDLTVGDSGLVDGDGNEINGFFSHEDTAGNNFKWEEDSNGNIIGVGIEDLAKDGSGQYAYDGDFDDIELSFGKAEADGDATSTVPDGEETMPLTVTQPMQKQQADNDDGEGVSGEKTEVSSMAPVPVASQTETDADTEEAPTDEPTVDDVPPIVVPPVM